MSTSVDSTMRLLLRPGQLVPGFALPDVGGDIVRLTSFRQRHPVLLAILHSATCPDCYQWLSGLAAARDELVYRDAQPLLIFPDDPATLRALQAKLGLPGSLLPSPQRETLACYVHIKHIEAPATHLPVLLVAIDRYNVCLDAWLAGEPTQWPTPAELLALFALAEQEGCACGLPIWPED